MNVACARGGAGHEASSRPARPVSFAAALRLGLAERLQERARTGGRAPVRDAPREPEPRPFESGMPAHLWAAAATAASPEGPSLAGPPSVHRVMLAVDVLRAGERSRVEIGLPGGFALRLETMHDGVALSITAAPTLARAAAAELPALVAALHRSGVRIARAEVRGGSQRRGASGRSR